MTGTRDEGLFAGYEGRIFGLLVLGWLGTSMVGMVLPPLLPAIAADLELSPAEAGVVMTAWWLTVALCNYPGGRFADRLTRKTAIVAGLALAALGVVGLSVAGSYALLLLAVAVVGAGRGLYQPAAISGIAALFEDRRGSAMGVWSATFNLGGVAAGGFAVAVLALATWRAAFPPLVAALVLALVLMHAWNREGYVVARVPLGVRSTALRLVRSRRIVAIVAALSLYGVVWNGAITFLPTYLRVEKGLSPAAGGLGFAAVFLVGGLSQPTVGRLGDRVGHPQTALGGALVCAAGLTLLLVAGTLATVGVALPVFAVGMAAFWPVMIAHGLGTVPSDSRGGDWGAVTAVFLGIESLGSTYVGVVAEHLTYDAAYAGLLPPLAVAIAITAWLAATADPAAPP